MKKSVWLHEVPRPVFGSKLRDIILGGQDGLVNVLGIVLGVGAATTTTKLVLISGLAAAFAESISMGAVAYTSLKAAKSYYQSEKEREKREIREIPEMERKEIREIYRRKGFSGKLLDAIVRKITSSKKLWLSTMMREELGFEEEKEGNLLETAGIVFLSSFVGSLIPLVPFVFAPVKTAMVASVVVSVAVLFVAGAVKARITVGSWFRSGIEMMLIGFGAALCGYIIGSLLGML